MAQDRFTKMGKDMIKSLPADQRARLNVKALKDAKLAKKTAPKKTTPKNPGK